MHTFTALATTAFKCNLCISALTAVQHCVMPVSSKSIGTLRLTWKLPRHWSYTLSMLTWNLREAAITAQVMHNRLSAGAIIQRQDSRNTGPVIWTEILQLWSFFTVFLLSMWISHAKQRPGQANALTFFPSPCTPQEVSVMCSVVQALGICVWALIIWRRLETQVTPSWSTALVSLVYRKKCYRHSYQTAFKRQEYSPLGQLCGKAKYF